MRINAVDDQMRDPMRQGIGLARSGAGDDQERRSRRTGVLSNAVFDGPPLFRIELLQIGDGHRGRSAGVLGATLIHDSCFVRNRQRWKEVARLLAATACRKHRAALEWPIGPASGSPRSRSATSTASAC